MIGLRWANTQQLKKDRNTLLQYVKADGFHISFDADIREKAKEIFFPVLQVFKDELSSSPLSLIFLYKASEQTGEFAGCDGIWLSYNDEENREITTIGISIELINGSLDYCLMVILHQLTHQFCNGCPQGFFGVMDTVFRRFNEATGRSFKNDYCERLSDTLIKTARGVPGATEV